MCVDKCIEETTKHIRTVATMIEIIAAELEERSKNHDKTKLEEPELSIFSRSQSLQDITYGSEEYIKNLERLSVALKHHYESNTHHPEHYDKGIAGMDLVDIIEMFCDWKASTLRHNDGDIYKSIEINKKRFHMSDDLIEIFKNTAKLFD